MRLLGRSRMESRKSLFFYLSEYRQGMLGGEGDVVAFEKWVCIVSSKKLTVVFG